MSEQPAVAGWLKIINDYQPATAGCSDFYIIGRRAQPIGNPSAHIGRRSQPIGKSSTQIGKPSAHIGNQTYIIGKLSAPIGKASAHIGNASAQTRNQSAHFFKSPHG